MKKDNTKHKFRWGKKWNTKGHFVQNAKIRKINERYGKKNNNSISRYTDLKIKPDINISAKDEYAFHLACSRGRLEVAQWFVSLNPDKYILRKLILKT